MASSDIKYPKLLEDFPDEFVEQAISEAKKSTDHFKQWLLETCHDYAINLLSVYHQMSMKSQLQIAANLTKLENLEDLKTNAETNHDEV